MTTVSNNQSTIKRLRRRSAKTATNTRTSRAMFGPNEARKELAIPEFIDMYNHFINGVNNADQLRCYYDTQQVHLKSWKPLWHFLLNTIVVNSYKIAHCTPERPYAESWKHHSHREFRVKLASQLFEYSERLTGMPTSVKQSLSSQVHPAASRDHGHLERMGDKAKSCRVCLYAGRKVAKLAKIRKPLSELSTNTVKTSRLDKRIRPLQTPRGIFGCKLCGIYICNHIACWKEHLEAIPCI